MTTPPHRVHCAGASLAALLLLAVTMAGCTQPERDVTEVRVGILLPMSGPLAEVGATMRLAVDRAAEQVNAAGGIGGKPLRLHYEDAGVDPAQAALAAQRARDAGVVAIVGAVASGASKAVVEVAAPAGIAVVSPGSTAPELTAMMAAKPLDERVFFRTVPSDALKAKVAAAYFLARNVTRVALLHDNNPYGNGVQAAFAQAFAAGGGALASVPFNQGQRSYDAALQQALRGCDAPGDGDCPGTLFFVGYDPEARTAVADWHARGAWRGVPWFFSELERGTFVALAGQGVPVAGFEGIQAVGAGTRFAEFTALMGGTPPAFSANAFDALLLVALAAEAAAARGSSVDDALRDVAGPPGATVGPGDYAGALGVLRKGEGVDYDGAGGRVDLDAFGDVTSPFEVFGVDAGGNLTRRCLVPEDAVLAAPPRLPTECGAS